MAKRFKSLSRLSKVSVVLITAVLLLTLTAGLLSFFAPHVLLRGLSRMQLHAAKFHPKQKVIDGILINYAEGGKGEEVVLMVHGFRAQMNVWLPYVPALKDRYRIILIDLPGFGGSARPGEGYSLQRLGQFIGHFLDALDIKQANLIGTSLGGGVCLSCAIERAELIRRVVAINPLVLRSPKKSAFEAVLEQGRNLFLPQTREDFYAMQEISAGKTLNLNPLIELMILRNFLAENPFYQQVFQEILDGGGLENKLHRIIAPVLFIQSDSDRVIDPSAANEVLSRVAHGQLHIVQGEHILWGSARERSIELIQQFLNESTRS